MTEYIQPPSDATAEATPYNKWKDPDFVRRYYREKRREVRGMKRHPNIIVDENGNEKLWSDDHPYGRFNTHREKLDNMAKYRKNIKKVECQICGSSYYETQQKAHCETKKHKSAVELLKKHHIL